MTHDLTAEVISIGTEILLGELTDTNSVHIARVFRDLGINIFFMTSVGDNKERIADAIRIARSRAQIVITCGGLGPTVDDMTRQGVAAATGRGLTFHQTLLDQIAERFAGFKVQMTENNRRQAYLPDEALVIENPVGTAPGFIVEVDDGAVISLPGVPREMKFLLAERVVPYLRDRYQLGVIKARILRTAGIGESMLDELIGDDLLERSNPTIGLAAHSGQVDVRVTAKATSIEQADHMIEAVEYELRQRIGQYIFGVDEDVLQEVVVNYLASSGQKIAVVQAGIGDIIARSLHDVAGGADVMIASYVYESPAEARAAYPDAANGSLRDFSLYIGQQVQEQSGAAACIVVLAQPDTSEASDSAEGTVVTVYTPGKTRDRVYGFGGRSEIARSWVVQWILASLWRVLREQRDHAS